VFNKEKYIMKLRQEQLKQLNALDRALTNINKALKLGEKNEQLGYNNGALANKYSELLEIYQQQFDVDLEDTELLANPAGDTISGTVSRGGYVF
jgi:hypothetical protein